jgi:hypothetical protein
MNAIAVSISGELVDPFGGVEDIGNRVIRCVGSPDDRFAEDALRMFRAYRFSAELGFDIEPETIASIGRNAVKAALISAERVRVELEKTLLSPRPEISGDMIKTGLLASYISEAGECPGGLAKLAALPVEAAPRWCAFCSLLIDGGSICSAGEFLRGMRLDSNTVKICNSALSVDGSLIEEVIHDRIAVKRLLAKHGAAAVRCAAAACRPTLRSRRARVVGEVGVGYGYRAEIECVHAVNVYLKHLDVKWRLILINGNRKRFLLEN